MTKEEILETRRRILGNKHMELFSDTILSMMDEFAKQQAKEFSKWITINLWSFHGDNWHPYMDDLYKLFIEQQNKQ